MYFVKRIAVGIIIAVTLLLVGSITPASACTSFAVYGDEPIYGMNFDFYDTEIRFVIPEEEFLTFDLFVLVFDSYGSYTSTVIMDEQGLFFSCQEQSPAQGGKSHLDEDEIYITDVALEVLRMQVQGYEMDVAGVLESIQGKKLVHWEEMGAHVLTADAGGAAAIIEVGEEENEILPIDGDFIVMTNFPNYRFKNLPYDQVGGTGSRRYITAHEYIGENMNDFDIDHAFETLRRTVQEGFTRCSMVFVPEQGSVYLALYQDFDKLWKISLSEKTMETYQGFDKDVKLSISQDGVVAADLRDGDFSDYEVISSGLGWIGKASLIAGVVLVLAVLATLSIRKKHESKHNQ